MVAEEPGLQWLDSYAAGMQQAKQSGRQMLVYFHKDKLTPKNDKLVQKLATDKDLRPLVEKSVLVRVPSSLKVWVGGKEIRLIQHAAFGGASAATGHRDHRLHRSQERVLRPMWSASIR